MILTWAEATSHIVTYKSPSWKDAPNNLDPSRVKSAIKRLTPVVRSRFRNMKVTMDHIHLCCQEHLHLKISGVGSSLGMKEPKLKKVRCNYCRKGGMRLMHPQKLNFCGEPCRIFYQVEKGERSFFVNTREEARARKKLRMGRKKSCK